MLRVRQMKRGERSVWGCVPYEMANLGFFLGYSVVGTLTPTDGNLDLEKYIFILDSHLWQVVANHFGNVPWIFQDDNSPFHITDRAK